jgi:hypothetical protein
MITTTWTDAPADLLGLGGAAVPSCSGAGMPVPVAMAPTFAAVKGTGVPTGGIAVRLRKDFRQTGTQERDHNYIGATNDGTTLGIHPPGRPLS